MLFSAYVLLYPYSAVFFFSFFFFQAEDGIRDLYVTGVQTCALPIFTACDPANGLFKARTSFIYTETRGDVLERYSGWASHDLIESDGHLKIKLKRIDLVNFDAPFGKDRKSTRLNSSHVESSYAVFCLK